MEHLPVPPANQEDNDRTLKPEKDRISIVEQFYFRPSGEEAEQCEVRFSRELDCVGQESYTRKCKATPTWKELDFGWVPDPSIFIIKNEEGKFPLVNPFPEEREEAARKIIEVSLFPDQSDNAFLVYPQDRFRGSANTNSVWVRSQFAVAKFTLYAYPK